MMDNLQALRIAIYKSSGDLKTETSRYFLSFLWWIVDPLIYFSVFYFLFAGGFRGGQGPEYAIFLIIGLTTFRWLNSTVNSAAMSISMNQNLIKLIYLPKWIFPLNVFFVNTVKFLVILVVAILIANIAGYPMSWYYLYLPLIICIQGALTLGMALPLAAIVPFVPDLQFIIGNVMMALFFLSGVFFDVSDMSENVQRLFYLNPAAGVLKAYRVVLMEAAAPNWIHLLWAAFVSLVLVAIGLYLLKRFDKVYAKVSN